MRMVQPARKPTRRALWMIPACALLCVGTPHAADAHRVKASPQPVDWPVYGGQKADDHYSPLTQINRSNVGRLRVAWTYDTAKKAWACRRAL